MIANSRKKKKLNLLSRPAVKLLFRLVMVLLLFSLSRWLIYVFNTDFFHHLTLKQALWLYLMGMRFDMVVIATINIPVILFFCLPFKFIYNRMLQSVVSIYYVVVNSAIVLLNMLDAINFRFIGKRMTSEVFTGLHITEDVFWSMIGQFVVDYWYILVLMVLLVMVLWVVSVRTRLEPEALENDDFWPSVQWVSLLVFAILTPIAARGGLQKRPVDMTTAAQYADSQNMPILLNAPFIIAKSPTSHLLVERHYFNDDEMDFSPIHCSTQPQRFVADSLGFQPNLVFIVLESFGQEMIGYYNPDRRYQLTPFLDELLKQSLTFDGRANGRRPNEALPSLFSGLPSLMDVDFQVSPYAGNKVDGIGTVLGAHGYRTSMFHGVFNEAKIFDEYALSTGIDRYCGRAEYNNDDDFDGRLGIFDGPFMQFCLDALDTTAQPFATVVYTLSSQHPYTLPKGFVMPDESYFWSGFEKTVYYADCALRDFFAEAQTKPWFDSTLFVITADHANTEHYLSEYSNIWGMYSIPIAFYMPSVIKPYRSSEIVQQIDLNLSIIAALGINDTVFSFGRNVFDTVSTPFNITYINQTYQYSDGQYLIQSDGDRTFGVFNIRRDPDVDDNLIEHIQCDDLSRKMKEIIQQYNNRVINNQLFIDKEAWHEQAEDTLYCQPDLGEVEPE